MNFYKFIIARLNGRDIEKDFDYYLRLVKKGIAGFIVFGGELNTVRQGIRELQKEADGCLIIASDLERGLGQHIEGGTIFPPAMAVASAVKKDSSRFTVHGSQLKLLRKIFKTIAIEARYAGINTIFAPVLDINTNLRNPIISTRAFGEDPESVSFFGCEMIKIFQSHGITACGKHFPGHGDTETDSHIKLPKIKKDIKALSKTELAPFRTAIKAGVKMIMLGHLNVPALDPSGIPVSLSQKAVSYLRNKLGFKGIIITDAMNMGGIGKYSEEEASLMVLNAGVDILLHPADPDRVAAYLAQKLSAVGFQRSGKSLFPQKIKTSVVPDFEKNGRLAEKITKMSIKIDGQIKLMKNPLLIILSDDMENKSKTLIDRLKLRHPNLEFLRFKAERNVSLNNIPENRELIVAVFSGIRAWKGGTSPWLLKCITELKDKTEIFISFGSPYLIDRVGNDATRIYAYWDSEAAQKAVTEVIMQG
ncbi:MAG: hypothetical protein HY035_03675 [Nitrospirae bacterium]|nr:hypothetical protein [Nitrospirota bacterium]MBI3377488.1 hypothetical protein [Nitrospirota bacterium]